MPRFRLTATVELGDGTEHVEEVDVTAAKASDALDETTGKFSSLTEVLGEMPDVRRLVFEIRKLGA